MIKKSMVCLDDSEKLAFLRGFCEAAVGAIACPKQAQYGEIMKGIDRFYQEPETLSVGRVAAR